jgi:HK97 family phage prohead protease
MTHPAGDILERRTFVGDVTLRAAPEGSKSPGSLVGYASVCNKMSLDLGNFREKIAPGAFTDALKTSDVRCLKNHDENLILGRNMSGTLTLVEDELGLKFDVELPNTQTGRDMAEEVRRGDISGCSFSFTTDVDEWDWSGQVPIRTVRKVKTLYDVGPVTYPAYDETSVACRSFRTAETAHNLPAAPVVPEVPISIQNARARQQLALASN